MSVNSKMTAIADQVRSLAGVTGQQTLDAMASNLSSANSSVANALAALVEKGVDTTGAGLAEIAGLIAGIETGGRLKYIESTFAVANETSSYTLTHNLGMVPDFVLFVINASVTLSLSTTTFPLWGIKIPGSSSSVGMYKNSSSTRTVSGSQCITENAETVTIDASKCDKGVFKAAMGYRVFVGVGVDGNINSSSGGTI